MAIQSKADSNPIIEADTDSRVESLGAKDIDINSLNAATSSMQQGAAPVMINISGLFSMFPLTFGAIGDRALHCFLFLQPSAFA